MNTNDLQELKLLIDEKGFTIENQELFEKLMCGELIKIDAFFEWYHELETELELIETKVEKLNHSMTFLKDFIYRSI